MTTRQHCPAKRPASSQGRDPVSTPTPPGLRRHGPAPQPFGPTLPRYWWAWPAAMATACAGAFAAFLASLAGEPLPYQQDLTPTCASPQPVPGVSAPTVLPPLPHQTVLATAQGLDLGPAFTDPRPNNTTYVYAAVGEPRLEVVQAELTRALQRSGYRVTVEQQAPPAPDPPRVRAPRTSHRAQLHRPQPGHRHHRRTMHHSGRRRLRHPRVAAHTTKLTRSSMGGVRQARQALALCGPSRTSVNSQRSPQAAGGGPVAGIGVPSRQQGVDELAARRSACRAPAAVRSRTDSTSSQTPEPSIRRRFRGQ